MCFLRRVILGLILCAMLVSCALPASLSSPSGVAQVYAPRSTYVLDVTGATATPTPFQPIPPTPALYPTGEPPAGASPLPTVALLATPTLAITLPVGGAPEEQVLEQLPSQVNILLLGSDKRPWDSGFRTDTIILVTLNKDLESVNITSFPRDLYITLPGWGTGRINTAFTYGGYAMLSKTFKHNFGIQPDYYVLINFSSFKKIVDGLGGLDVKVAQSVSDYRAGYWTTIPKDMVHMDADTVLWYVRTRKTTNDFARNRRQQEVLQALFDKLLSMNALRRAPEFYQLYKDNVTTDLGLMDVLAWLPLAAKIAESRNIKQYYVGPEQVYDWISPEGAMVLLPNQQAVMDVIRQSQNLP